MDISTSTENVHSIVYHSCCMKVSVWRWRSMRMDKAPFHCLKIQTMNITRKLIYHFFESAKNVHAWSDNTRRMSVSCSGQVSGHSRRFPFKGFCVEAEQNITHLDREKRSDEMSVQNCIMSTHHLVISSTKKVNLTFVCTCRVSYNGFILFSENRNRCVKTESFSCCFWPVFDYAKMLINASSRGDCFMTL